MSPRVTVVIPARNAADTIAATIESIAHQSSGPPTIVVVDDSDDLTAAVAADSADPVTVIAGPRRGIGAARNRGAALARTELVAFCDADDLWPRQRLERDLAALAADPGIGILLGRTRFDADDPSLVANVDLDDGGSALIPHFGAATMTIAAFEQVGPIAEDLSHFEDYDWFLRARETSAGLVTHDRITLWRRMHEGSTSRMSPPSGRDLLAVLRRSVNRRPEAVGAQMAALSDLRREVE